MRISILIFFISISILSFSQKRVGLDFNTQLDNMTVGFNYYHVVKGNWFLSTGVYFGIIGGTKVTNNPDILGSSFQVESPYSNANKPLTIDSIDYQLIDYGVTASGVGLNLGIGYFHEFNVKHGIRGNLNYRTGMVGVRMMGRYHSLATKRDEYSTTNTTHSFHAATLELYHTIRLNGRFTFYYGVKAPYYFNYANDKFDPKTSRDLLDGIEADFSLGFTRVVGKCE